MKTRDEIAARWVIRARKSNLAGLAALPTHAQLAVKHFSMSYWARTVANEQSVTTARGLRIAENLPARLRGSGACTYGWEHCAYCAHGRALRSTVRFLEMATPIQTVTFRDSTGALTLAELLQSTADTLSLFKAASPRSALQVAQLVPSNESATPSTASPHIHATLGARVSWNSLGNVASLAGLVTSGETLREGSANVGGWLAYCYAQMVSTAVGDGSFGPHHHRVRTWTPGTSRLPVGRVSAATIAVREGYAADSARMRNGSQPRAP